MNAPAQAEAVAAPYVIGQHLPEQGGHFAGLIRIGGEVYGLVVAPKEEGETKKVWNERYDRLPGALSFFDGKLNTNAMADAGSLLAEWALGLKVNSFADWYLPARDELELLYRGFKPTTESNYCWRGDNPSSVPAGYAYSEDLPAQTTAEGYQEEGDNAFDEAWYWSSTQYAGGSNYAWCQDFSYGNQDSNHKGSELRARAVRRFKLQ